MLTKRPKGDFICQLCKELNGINGSSNGVADSEKNQTNSTVEEQTTAKKKRKLTTGGALTKQNNEEDNTDSANLKEKPIKKTGTYLFELA